MAKSNNELRIEYVRLQEIAQWPGNPKSHDLPELIESFERFGFAVPLLYDERSKRLTAGHGRLEALEELKGSGAEPPANVAVQGDDWLVPVVRGLSFSSESEAEAFLLASNEIGVGAGYDKPKLMAALQRQMGNLKGTGFNARRAAAALREQQKSTGRKPSSTRGLGESKPVFTIEFANEEQREAWLRIVGELERVYPEGKTLGERILMLEREFSEKFAACTSRT